MHPVIDPTPARDSNLFGHVKLVIGGEKAI
jgi:hypothetical protein